MKTEQKTGSVYLVGAGPGDPGLITVRGVECLCRAEVLVYDYLANEQLLNYAPSEAEHIYATGPKVSSRATTMAGVTLVRMVG